MEELEKWCRICGTGLHMCGHRLDELADQSTSLEEMLSFCVGKKEANGNDGLCGSCKEDLLVAYKLIQLYHKTTKRLFKTSIINSSSMTKDLNYADNNEAKRVTKEPKKRNHKTSSKIHSCSKCDASFGSSFQLKKHRELCALENVKPKCCGCLREFESLELLKAHSDTVHKPVECKTHPKRAENESSFTCDICYRCYKTHRILVDHRQRPYRTKQYQCARCGKPFRDKCSLDDHERLHEGARPFVCIVCSKTFALKDSYRKHLRLHTVASDRYKCDVCGKGCRTKGNLKDHYITHSGAERSLQCPRCESRFARKSCLQAHVRLHTGEKPFACKQCDARYTFSSDLRRHVMAHKGIRPFVCEVCNRSYSRRDYLLKHIATSHPEELKLKDGTEYDAVIPNGHNIVLNNE